MKKDATPQEIAAYTAGIIDGEGSIQIRKTFDKRNNNNYYCLRVTVVNTDERLMQWMTKSYGGYVLDKCPPKGTNWKRAYCWYIQGKRAESFLILIFAYITLKKEQAIVAFSFINKQWHEENEMFFIKMKELNRKGAKSESLPT